MLNITIPYLFVLPNANRNCATRAGVVMMTAVPSEDHRASLSAAGATRGKMPIRVIDFPVDRPN
jgi:hypothetical protein